MEVVLVDSDSDRALVFASDFVDGLSQKSSTFTPLTDGELTTLGACLSDTESLWEEMRQATENW